MPLNRSRADLCGSGICTGRRRTAAVGDIIKFPDDGRIVRFGRADGQDEAATVIILPVIRIERHADMRAEEAEPHTRPPARGGGRRRMRRR